MDRKKILIDSWISNTEQLTKKISEFDFETFNRKPADGGWSAGEIAEHILIFDIRLNTVLPDATSPSQRDPHAQIKSISDRLEDRGNKIDAPEFLKPSGIATDPQAIIEKIRTERNKVLRFIDDNDLSLTNAKTPHRLFGTLTALEWIALVMQHTARHLHQFDDMLRNQSQ
jgi:uncharacterized damage-inducible protein DinB